MRGKEWEPGAFLAFANELYSQGDYIRAAGEFERYLSITENQGLADRDSVLLKTGFCYLGAGDYFRALDYLKKVRATGDSSLVREAWLNTAFIYFREGNYIQSIQILRDSSGFTADARAQLMLALNYFQLRKWGESGRALRKVTGPDTLSPYFRQFQSAEEAGLEIPYKNPSAAGILSAVVPGSGKMYAGRFKDGIFSLALVGITGALAYQGFHRDKWKSLEGWFFGSLSLGFYGGNIYGSVLAAKQANLARENNVLEDLSFSLNARLPF